MMIKFEISGQPQGKARPRVTRYGTYTPSKTKAYQDLVRYSFSSQVDIDKPSDNPLIADIECFYKIPKNTSKKRRESMLSGDIKPVVKPDLDNVAKAILDALNGLAYKDDNQVIRLNISKHYGDMPKVIVRLSEV